jgi:hypothetical protein
MFDIDKYLEDIALKEITPDEDVITRSKKRCEEEQAKMRARREALKKVKKGAMIAVPAAAVLLLGVLIGASLFPKVVTQQPELVAYYTVDVNPSVRVQVDGDDIVTGVAGQNGDADAVVKKLDCVGKPIADAIHEIVAAVKDLGYFDGGERYVLIGCFTADGARVSGTLSSLQSRLEADFGDMIELLIVSGSLEDFEAANELKVSPGLLKLAQMADGVEVKGGEKVDEVQQQVQNVNEPKYCAPFLSKQAAKDGVKLSWEKLDFEKMGYASKVIYGIAMGDTEQEVKSMKAGEIKKIEFYAYGEPDTAYKVTSLKPGETKYFAIYAHYGDIVKCSNIVSATMPAEEEKPKASEKPGTVNTRPPGPAKAADDTPAHTVSGKTSGDKIVLSWTAETADNFQGYKIVASKMNPNPKYPDDGYIKYITDRDKTSLSISAGSYGLKGGAEYYFSVTYLFKDGSAIAGNAVKLKVPHKTTEPAPTENPASAPTQPAGEYAASSVSGSITDSTISLSWERIGDDRFEGYKVVASFSNPSPSYPGDGYLYYITDRESTSKSFNVSKLGSFSPGQTCYFSITVLYKGGVKKAGNAISLAMPAAPAPAQPAGEYAASSVSGSITDSTISLNWERIADDRFEGYKVVASFSNPSPSYPGDGYLYYITDRESTSKSFNVSKLGSFSPGQTCYFSITVLYKDGVKKAGNAISLAMPAAPAPAG